MLDATMRAVYLDAIVSTSHCFAIVGRVLLGAALAGVTVVIFDTVIGRPGAWIAGGAALVALVVFWFVTPLPMRRRADRSY